MSGLPRNTILIGDALTQLRTLPTAAVDCVITSPPYYGLRDYGVPGQLGAEPRVEDWVTGLTTVMGEVARVLRPGGAAWLNLGDSYSRHGRYGALPKSLLLAPERLALALSSDGWIVRNKVVWSKPNATPSSVADRLQPTHEFIYFLVRSRRYHFNLDAIRVPYRSPARRTPAHTRALPASATGPLAQRKLGLQSHDGTRHALGKNPGDVWTIPTRPYPEAHFATFPAALVEPPLLATCPRWTCESCGAPWTGERPGCGHNAGRVPGIVLDPFLGTGTVAVVAEEHGRDWLGIELNPAYAALARERLHRARRTQEQAA